MQKRNYEGPTAIQLGAMKSATTSLKSFMVHNSNLKVCNLEVINDAKFNSRKILDEQNIFDQGYYLRKNLERDNSFLIPYLKSWKNTAIIIVLRDPLERFKSHIHHSLLKNVRRNGNRLSILNHTYKFPNKIFYELDIKKTSEDELRSHNFFARGLYYEMLKELLENVPNERFIFIGTDKISNSAIPKMILNHIRDISNFKVEIDIDKKISIENSREMMKNNLYFGLKKFFKPNIQIRFTDYTLKYLINLFRDQHEKLLSFRSYKISDEFFQFFKY